MIAFFVWMCATWFVATIVYCSIDHTYIIHHKPPPQVAKANANNCGRHIQVHTYTIYMHQHTSHAARMQKANASAANDAGAQQTCSFVQACRWIRCLRARRQLWRARFRSNNVWNVHVRAATATATASTAVSGTANVLWVCVSVLASVCMCACVLVCHTSAIWSTAARADGSVSSHSSVGVVRSHKPNRCTAEEKTSPSTTTNTTRPSVCCCYDFGSVCELECVFVCNY